ncbi:MAG TPA: nucleoside transporter C-terminal domain-containing protein [Gemmatales bacterium]|nr:nucleoside transporter C-terminal domain-containing protein [Gemmatales bacterium]
MADAPPAAADPIPPGSPGVPPTPLWWRFALLTAVAFVGLVSFTFRDLLGPRGQAATGIIAFIGIVAAASTNLRAVRWRTLLFGMVLQLALALFVLKARISIDGQEYSGYQLFQAIGNVIKTFLAFTGEGARFVFGILADPAAVDQVFPNRGFIFAFAALPTIIFASSFFSILFYLGVLQIIVKYMALSMMFVMRTSGAETLSAAANVFLGQTEAPLIVKPYVGKMTQSELLALMVGGMATISGGIMAVYIAMGADAVAILATSVMAAPCGLYLAKLMQPETEEPQTLGRASANVTVPHRNLVDAAASGATDGMSLAINVAAMLIAFLALLAMVDALLQFTYGALNLRGGVDWLLATLQMHEYQAWPELNLRRVFSVVFAPLAFLMGVTPQDIPAVADLLGTKLVLNEFVAYKELTTTYRDVIDPRSYILATYALTGFANFGSIGIQLGGIGAMAPERRSDLAKLGMKALFVGFLTTLLNAAVAGLLL